MADNHNTTESGMDYKEHESTFALFTKLVKYGCVGVTLVLVMMALFLLPKH